MQNKHGFTTSVVVLVVVVLVLVVGGLSYALGRRSESPTNSGPVLTESAAFGLVKSAWGDCSRGDCGGVVVAVAQDSDNQYVVTAIYSERDDATSQTKRVSIATYQNGEWILSEPTVTRACNRGHVDGSEGFSPAFCI